MKELTIEEKAKAYDKAFRIAQELYNNPNSSNIGRGYVCTVFPELKENEDERIRTALLEMVHDTTGNSLWIDYNVYEEDVIAWLEKQGEKSQGKSALETIKEEKVDNRNYIKPADNVEPKFHNGNWIIHQGTENIYQVVAIIDNQYQLKYGDNYTVQKCADVDRCARLWNFTKDAKDGDMLCAYECDEPKIVFILKGTPKKHYALSYRCYYNIMYPHFGSDSEKGCLAPNDEDVKPATKEQRDTLMKAMTDAGYTFDFDKKELKKIEQKPAWSEEDEKMLSNIVDCIKNLPIFYESININGEDKITEGFICDVINWLKSLRPQKQWKPSDEQIKALQDLNLTGGISYAGQGQTLIELYNNLKKL